MSDDPRKELEQLEMLLILDEDWFQRELDSAKRMIGQQPEQPTPAARVAAPAKATPVRNYQNGYGKATPQRPKPEPEEAPLPRHKGIKGLLILAVLEAMGILGLAIYWALVLLK